MLLKESGGKIKVREREREREGGHERENGVNYNKVRREEKTKEREGYMSDPRKEKRRESDRKSKKETESRKESEKENNISLRNQPIRQGISRGQKHQKIREWKNLEMHFSFNFNFNANFFFLSRRHCSKIAKM